MRRPMGTIMGRRLGMVVVMDLVEKRLDMDMAKRRADMAMGQVKTGIRAKATQALALRMELQAKVWARVQRKLSRSILAKRGRRLPANPPIRNHVEEQKAAQPKA